MALEVLPNRRSHHGLDLLNHVWVLFLVLGQRDWKVLQVELEAHHVLCQLGVQDLEHLLSNVQLIVPLQLGRATTLMAIALVSLARRVGGLEAPATVILTHLAACLTPLAKLTAELAHQVQVVIRLLAIR